MTRAPATFKQADVMRAIKATRAAGLEIQRTEIERDGRIVLIHKQGSIPDDTPDAALQDWKAKNNGANSA
jgi:hypothetical protein